jgi:hypothetical protein
MSRPTILGGVKLRLSQMHESFGPKQSFVVQFGSVQDGQLMTQINFSDRPSDD